MFFILRVLLETTTTYLVELEQPVHKKDTLEIQRIARNSIDVLTTETTDLQDTNLLVVKVPPVDQLVLLVKPQLQQRVLQLEAVVVLHLMVPLEYHTNTYIYRSLARQQKAQPRFSLPLVIAVLPAPKVPLTSLHSQTAALLQLNLGPLRVLHTHQRQQKVVLPLEEPRESSTYLPTSTDSSSTVTAGTTGSTEITTPLDSSSGTTDSTTEPPTGSTMEPCPIGQLEGEQVALICPTGFRRHPKYCNLFYQCTKGTNNHDYKILVLSCPDGTLYDDEKIQCLPQNETRTCTGEIATDKLYKMLDDSSMPPVSSDKKSSKLFVQLKVTTKPKQLHAVLHL
ncbi:hypothetical protein NQ318_014027 [Aromia moschata]|uniref:Chitin-binding type-2 domain-containing protein n=1 Tax=Aromia moschata TaxID=1265417 RepID=A0AAV8YZN0_9CUCU|nr:hypothetical protein NQ318_014027 [Aromia moschata]